MTGMGNGHIDQFHIRIGQKVRVRAIGPRNGKTRGKGLRLFQRTGANGQTLHVFHGSEGDGGFLSNMARPDNSYIHKDKGTKISGEA